jgi:hypothetical protein
VEQYVADANDGKGSVRFELVLSRVMWELSFREFALGIARLAADTARRAEEIRSRAIGRPER